MKRIAILPILFVIAILGATAQTDSTEFMKRLCKLQGISNVSKLESTQYSEKYVIKVKQNVDGTDDSKGTFDQRVIVGFRDYNRPTVIVTEGYSADY